MDINPSRGILMRTVAVVATLLASAPGLVAQEARPVTSAPGPVTSVDPRILHQLEAIRDTAWRAWFSNDEPTMQRILPANFIGIGWGGDPWMDKAAAMAGAAAFVKDGGRLASLRFPTTRVHLFGNVAVVYSNYEVDFDMGGTVTHQAGRSTEVFTRQADGSWHHPSWHLDSGK